MIQVPLLDTSLNKTNFKSNNVKVYYQNVRGLRTKLDLLNKRIPFSDYDVIVFTETWLCDAIFDNELGFHDFEIFRCDRLYVKSDEVGGGVLIAIRKSYPSRIIKSYNSRAHFETLFVLMKLGSHFLLLNALYITKPSHEIFTIYTELLENIFLKYPDSYFSILGDFNLPFLVWELDFDSVKMTYYCSNSMSDILLNSLAYLGMFQINNFKNSLSRTLDLLFVNFVTVAVSVSDDPILPLDNHHPAFIGDFCFDLNLNNLEPNKIIKFCPKKARFDLLKSYFNEINWDCYIDDYLPLESQIHNFYQVVRTALDHFVPKISISHHKFPKWFSKDLKDKVIAKKALHRKFKETNNPYFYSQFSEIRRKCNVMSHIDYKNYIEKTEKYLVKNPRKFFDYVRSKKQDHGVPKNMHLDDKNSMNGKDTADLFANHFSSVYSLESLCPPFFNYGHSLTSTLSAVDISENDVLKKLRELKPLSSVGPDGIPPIILKECASHLVVPLTHLFNKSISKGVFPKIWKQSYVKPIHKSGDKTNIKNYRAISKISTIPKIFESIVYDKIKNVLTPLINECQHGFVKSKSTTSNLISFYQFLISSLDQGCQVDVIYTDFSKAFDKVNVNILISKLHSLGISDPLLSWFHEYLASRSQIVQVEDYLSEIIDVPSGCPQGGHLSGFLFNLYINDLANHGNNVSKVSKWFFADDYRVARIISRPEDCFDLQNSLCDLVDWCNLNRMYLNVDKCYVATFHRKTSPIFHNYAIDNKLLARNNNIKDLGVYIDLDLKFSSHYEYITKKGYRNLGFIERNTRNFKSPWTYKALYCSLVRSSLEYCTTLWSPSYITYIDQIEKIQKKFLRSLGFRDCAIKDNHDYKTIMDKYNLKTLQHRRDVFDILFILKLINAHVECPDLLQQLSFRCNARQTRNRNVFSLKTCKTNISKTCPLNRCMELCNIISNEPHNIDIYFQSTASIKSQLLNLFSLH